MASRLRDALDRLLALLIFHDPGPRKAEKQAAPNDEPGNEYPIGYFEETTE